jgi:hypothetical protein
MRPLTKHKPLSATTGQKIITTFAMIGNLIDNKIVIQFHWPRVNSDNSQNESTVTHTYLPLSLLLTRLKLGPCRHINPQHDHMTLHRVVADILRNDGIFDSAIEVTGLQAGGYLVRQGCASPP